MRFTLLFTGFLIHFTACNPTNETSYLSDPAELVNPLMGTDSEFTPGNGYTFPAIVRTWGMNFRAPQTGKLGNVWMHQYDACKLRGFKQTHLPGSRINDYGKFSLIAARGKPVFDEDEWPSWFSRKAETVKPYLYEVYLADYDVKAAFTASERAAGFEFTFPQSDSSNAIIDVFDGGFWIKIIPEEKKAVGYTTKNSGGVAEKFKTKTNEYGILVETKII
ncbi:MAG: hypothetical protein ACOC10_08985 [Bacteroidota bacterium]